MSTQSTPADLPAAQVESAPATKQHGLPQAAVFNPEAEMPNIGILKDGVPGNISIAISYHEFQQGIETRGIYMGLLDYTFFSKYSNQIETKKAAVFVNEKGQIRLNSAVRFVSALEKCAEKTAFLAVMTGLVKKGDRNLQDFDIYLLN